MAEQVQAVEETNQPAPVEAAPVVTAKPKVVMAAAAAEPAPAKPTNPEPMVVANKPAPKPLIQRPAQPGAQKEDVAVEFTKFVADVRATGSVAEKWLVDALDRYVDNMAPRKPVNPDVGLKHQFSLWHVITRVLNEFEPREFNKLWNILVAYFKYHKDGSFGIRYALRFTDRWPEPREDELFGFESIINLLRATVEDRATVLKKVSIDKTVSKGFSEVARGRLILFYAS